MSMRPPIEVMSFLTTSMPTPRPASSLTVSAVDRPEAKMSCAFSASESGWPCSTTPVSTAFL